MSKKKFSGNISGKGYYIALVLCAVAIGISGYLYYRHANKNPVTMNQNPSSGVNSAKDPDIAAVATQPAPGENPGQTDTQKPSGDMTKPATKPAKVTSPLSGETVAKYSMEALSYNTTTRDWRVHNGMDIAAEAGTEVCAAADGTVYTVYDDEMMGMTVVISHDGGYTTRYSSLAQEVSVAPGDQVTLGQTIGTVGNTALLETAIGDHLHFGVMCNGKAVDPATFLTQE